ncbi:MAG: carbohydrate binding family 9 domain-containing protein, partial [Gemmatimonadota bacterium]|nr:carbohydrate binding family 9 domain-containing protein [Gemmatimonadota bacterium]
MDTLTHLSRRFVGASPFPQRVFVGLSLLGLTLIAAPPDIRAQAGGAGQGGTNAEYNHDLAPRARAVRTQAAIDVDGRLDEAVWTQAPVITDLLQEDPDEGAPGSERTEFRIAFDDNAIYIGAILYDRFPVTGRLARRDAGQGDFDYITISLDSFHDHETVYQFAVNASGSFRDAVLGGGGGRGGGDISWDPVWHQATQVTEAGWSAEVRIPFSQLRFRPDNEQVWGIQLRRNILRNQERVAFPFVPTLDRGGASRFAHLEGIENIRSGQKFEFL